ncbi:ABC transporter ATP-binding protein [Flavobacterium sp.]|jgi:subfamily B ATP-binding cassette protein MsbA|uniref:ABC transporter ATP-binding protein n=1 Tax=Flavobacterium sp. TaxID=239 RepID=UPI0037C01071
MTNFKKIVSFAKPYKKYAYLNIFFNILYALFSTLTFVAMVPMLSVLFKEESGVIKKPDYRGFLHIKSYLEDYLGYFINSSKVESGIGYTLTILVAMVISTFLLKNLANYFAMVFGTIFKNGTGRDLRNAMFQKAIDLPLAFYSKNRKGDMVARVTGDVGEVQSAYLGLLDMIIKEPLTIIFTIIMMFSISTKLTMFVFIFIPISGYIISVIGKRLKKQSTRAQQESGISYSILDETLSGLKIVKGFNAEDIFKNKFYASSTRSYQLANKISNRQNLASPISEFLGIMVIAILLWYGGKMVLIDKTLFASAFIAYMGLAYNVLTPAKAISKASYDIKRGNAAAERVLEILEREIEIKDKKNAIEKSSFEKEVTVENINFSYGDENVLKQFSITIPKGKTVALVGQSGSGKSTIANLLTRFYDVQDGAIKIDGLDLKDMKIKSLRNLIGLVTQDSILFNDTIKENIKLGKPDATDNEIIEALIVANAYEFVNDLPNGINTNIGDAGNRLSGGQKQRLNIARAVLKNPPIMILDEATSALDTESEKFVQVALENMMQNRTSIVIAHRLSTIQKADKIVVMHRGEIVEQGTHEELLALNGTYSKLVLMQSFE